MKQKVLILLPAVLIHTPAGVAKALILEIKRVMFAVICKLALNGSERAMAA